VCDIFCEHGNVMDEKGCPTCKCKDAPKPDDCPPQCPIPLCIPPPSADCKIIPPKPDKCGCVFCPTYDCEGVEKTTTTEMPCAIPGCAAPPEGCRYGKPNMDDRGCQIDCGELMCKEECEPVRCRLFCENGFAHDENGCEVCKCKEEPTIPEHCSVWFDGCNTCKVGQDGSLACTEMACLKMEKPYCREYSIPKDCVSWHDGCNDCMVRGGVKVGCTRMACLVQGTPFCKEYMDDEEPVCGPVCDIFCEHGNVMDEKGCPTCKCKEAPAPSTASPIDPTTVTCTAGRDAAGRKCDCKDISGCRACTITKSGDKRVETCVECEADRFSVNGKCPKTQVCKREKLEGSGAPCKCRGTKSCRACVVTTDDTLPSRCTACKRDMFFHEGTCVETCPEGLAHVGKHSSSYGRSCQQPHACVKGKVATLGHPRFGKKCRCHSSDCLDCHFHAHSSGIKGTCSRCTNKLFHHEGECKSECPAHLTHHGLKKHGRACLEPFTCSFEDAKAGKCFCHKTCRGCHWKAGNEAKQHACQACSRKKLQPDAEGKC